MKKIDIEVSEDDEIELKKDILKLINVFKYNAKIIN